MSPQDFTIGSTFVDSRSNILPIESALISDLQAVERYQPGGTAQPRVFAYDAAFSQLASHTDERGHQTLFTVDPVNGNRLAMREVVGLLDGAGNSETDDLVTQYSYNARGQVLTTTDPHGRVTEFSYDALGRVVEITYAKGTVDQALETYEYDQNTRAFTC